MADLTDEELAELRSRTLAPVARGTPAMLLGADVVSRLLDEIERRRVQDLLDAPETPEEKAALDALASDPERILERSRKRLLEHTKARTK